MTNPNCLLFTLVLLTLGACHKRSQIEADQIAQPARTEPGDLPKPTTPAAPVAAVDWKEGSPANLVGNWASSLFQDQRCTAFYTFTTAALAELNLICLNAEKKQFEREYRRYTVAQYPGTQQVRFKPKESSCPGTDNRGIKAEGAAFLYAVENKPMPEQPTKMALWEPDVNKTPLNLSKSDGLMAEGFPGKTGTYLGMPIVTGCFTEGLVAKFEATPTP
ncbi:MAG TPA: hypothetical protein VFO10_23135 [Oligoflexus sp.]|uniref:hypothetical protein n=1 Tax=Oligoflexus sp. TaxID=1971216 RepID=UPI002D7EE7FC|nr:hypothetical protein [Oligoflexus sp.]HET9240177.1 hypothetical protein [Oligoflexus sp.]